MPAACPQVQVYRENSRLLNTGLEKYFDSATFSDVTVVSPSSKRMRVHQLVLAACSRRFAAILEHGGRGVVWVGVARWRGRSKVTVVSAGDFAGQDLPVQGVDADALELVLRFFYTGDCPISITTAVPLYDTSTKLEVLGLASACEQFITQLMHPLTSSIFLEQALQLKMDLTDMLLAYVRSRLGGGPDARPAWLVFTFLTASFIAPPCPPLVGVRRFEEVTSSDTFPAIGYETLIKVRPYIYHHHHHHHQKVFRNKSHTSHGHRPGLKRNKNKGKRLTIN